MRGTYEKLVLLSTILIIFTSCSNKPFSAEFDLANQGVILDSLLQLSLKITNETSVDHDLNIHWRIASDNGKTIKEMEFPYFLKADSLLYAYPPLHHFKKCGFYRIEAQISNENYKEFAFTNVVMNPEDIRSPLRKPHDFDQFWQTQMQQCKMLDMNPQLEAIETSPDSKIQLFEVTLTSIDNIQIKGWLELPKKKGKYPTLLRLPGYTENLEPIQKYSDMIIFSLNVRNHGKSEDVGIREYEMWVRGLESKENFFYKNIFLDCFTGLNYLCNREDVDTSRLAVWGGSQGGGLSLLTAAFDPRIDLCIADIPFLSDWERYFEISHWYELDQWMSSHPEYSWNNILDVLSYFDTKNMAQHISCPVWMGIGLQDDVCPPATSFATYNLLSGKKKHNIYPAQFHSQPQHHYDNRWKEMRMFFKLN